MGAVFSHLCTRADELGVSFGQAIGINTVGAALAPFVFGVVLVTSVGSRLSLLIVAAGYLLLASPRAWGCADAVGWLLPLPPRLRSGHHH
jgi:spermidine synthase